MSFLKQFILEKIQIDGLSPHDAINSVKRNFENEFSDDKKQLKRIFEELDNIEEEIILDA